MLDKNKELELIMCNFRRTFRRYLFKQSLKRLEFGLTKQRVSICFNKDSYSKEMKDLAYLDNDTFHHACCTTIFGEGIEDDRYVIGINADIKLYSVLQIEALLIHELNHLVTKHMIFHSFTCDEYRSTLLQQLYIDIKPYLDNYLNKDAIDITRFIKK